MFGQKKQNKVRGNYTSKNKDLYFIIGEMRWVQFKDGHKWEKLMNHDAWVETYGWPILFKYIHVARKRENFTRIKEWVRKSEIECK